MITATGLTKRYETKAAVDGLTFEVNPGIITGFLGPNGAGKSTTMRLILGLDAATAGSVTVNGQTYRDKRAPMREIGALIDPSAVHGGRSAYHHLLWQAQAGGLPDDFVDRMAITGDPDRCLERLSELAAAGLDKVILSGPTAGAQREEAARSVALLEAEVVARLPR